MERVDPKFKRDKKSVKKNKIFGKIEVFQSHIKII